MAGVVSPCESQAAELGLHSAGKAAVHQPKIHNILGRMHLIFLKISLPLQRLSIGGARGEEPKHLTVRACRLSPLGAVSS